MKMPKKDCKEPKVDYATVKRVCLMQDNIKFALKISTNTHNKKIPIHLIISFQELHKKNGVSFKKRQPISNKRFK
jgi:hypothetical protein